ncbi:MAG: type I phosphomannose isomerase catalytic subunit [Chloroflexota bacterium]|nr:type I phosphomannose isomerase catalytic subunit [Chloroflexota bacterium]
MTEPYPMLFKPVLKDYIWGGRNLEKLGRVLPESGIVAESWEISNHKDGISYVINGIHTGKSLQDVLELQGEDLVGSHNQWAIERNKFPLLVKLLDASQRLSIQVHPDDEYAGHNEGNELGKYEMWVVLDANPDAAIMYGFSKKITPQEFFQAITEGTLENFLNKLPIKVGDHICIPAGTLHTILGGAVMAEIQQNSNTTYRVYDWNRVGDDGQPRALHIEKALDVINFNQIGCKLPSPELVEKRANFTREVLCKNNYFTTERIFMQAKGTYSGFCDGSTLEIWGILSGEACVAGQKLTKIQFVLLPANLGAFKVSSSQNTILLRTFVE